MRRHEAYGYEKLICYGLKRIFIHIEQDDENSQDCVCHSVSHLKYKHCPAGIFCRAQVAGCRLKFNYNWKTAGTKKKRTGGRLTVTVTWRCLQSLRKVAVEYWKIERGSTRKINKNSCEEEPSDMKNKGQSIKTYKCFLTVAMTVKLGRV